MSWCSVLVLLVVACAASAYPIHASCILSWSFPNTNCSFVNVALVSQIKNWGMNTPCGSTEKCRYQLKSSSSKKLKLTHSTPVRNYTDCIEFSFFPKKKFGCEVYGFSISEIWYALLDFGTNYCNMHNLLTGAGLDKARGFVEKTDNSICTEYTTANCNKY
ncbi:uncharacterized protein [Oscarella lobularis]|uniref:uncharacterized protein n=1 Tax=Oscarella lobularis TaxID=121494 RepID=UPI003313B252